MKQSAALGILFAVMLCATAAALAQGTNTAAANGETAAQTAGDEAAYRALLAARKCSRTKMDYYQQDAAAQSLYFPLYNTAYASKSDPLARLFSQQAKQRTDAILKAPRNYDLSATCEAVLNEVRTHHLAIPLGPAPGQRLEDFVPTLNDVAGWCKTFKTNACWCEAPNFTPPKSPKSWCETAQTWTPNGLWPRHLPPLELPNITVYADYCFGRAMDGIMFLPKTTGTPTPPETQQSEPACDAANVHIRQFVYTRCVGGFQECGKSYTSGCPVERNFYTWYLDECPTKPGESGPRHLIPDFIDDSGVHVISDEPTVNLAVSGNAQLEKDFVDVMICDDGKTQPHVLGTFGWTRKGAQAPQWCSLYKPNPTNDRLLAAPYSDLRALDPRSDTVRTAVCQAKLPNGNLGDQGLVAIFQAIGNCP